MVTVGNGIWYPYVRWAGSMLPYPSITDALFLSSYAMLLAGLVVLIHSGSAGRDRASLLDAAIMASGLGVLGWVYLIAPQLANSTLSLAGRAATIAYPMVNVVLVGILARMAFAPWSCPGSVDTLTLGTFWSLERNPCATHPSAVSAGVPG
jgi:hypothetical protein